MRRASVLAGTMGACLAQHPRRSPTPGGLPGPRPAPVCPCSLPWQVQRALWVPGILGNKLQALKNKQQRNEQEAQRSPGLSALLLVFQGPQRSSRRLFLTRDYIPKKAETNRCQRRLQRLSLSLGHLQGGPRESGSNSRGTCRHRDRAR